MPQIVQVPGLGEVSFPDEMSPDQISAAIRRHSLIGNTTPGTPETSPDTLTAGNSGNGYSRDELIAEGASPGPLTIQEGMMGHGHLAEKIDRSEPNASATEKILRGGSRGAVGFIDSLLNPVTLLTAGLGAEANVGGRGMSALFGAGLATGAVQAAHQLYKAIQAGDYEGAAEALVSGGLSGYFGYKSLRHATSPGIANESPAIRSLIEKQIATEYTPEQMRDIYSRVTANQEHTPAEAELVRFVNANADSPMRAIRSGIKRVDTVNRLDRFPNLKDYFYAKGKFAPTGAAAVPPEPEPTAEAPAEPPPETPPSEAAPPETNVPPADESVPSSPTIIPADHPLPVTQDHLAQMLVAMTPEMRTFTIKALNKARNGEPLTPNEEAALKHLNNFVEQVNEPKPTTPEVSNANPEGQVPKSNQPQYPGSAEVVQQEGQDREHNPEVSGARTPDSVGNVVPESGQVQTEQTRSKIRVTGSASKQFEPVTKDFLSVVDEHNGEEPVVQDVVIKNSGHQSVWTEPSNPAAQGTIFVNPALLHSDTSRMTPKQKRAYLAKVVQEEVIHNQGGRALLAKWTEGGSVGTFQDFYKQQHIAIYNELTPKQRASLKKNYPGATNPVQLAEEFIRRTIQDRIDGKTTEQSFGNRFLEYLKSLLKQLKNLLSKAFGRADLKDNIQAHVNAIEQMLAEPARPVTGAEPEAGAEKAATVPGNLRSALMITFVRDHVTGRLRQASAGEAQGYGTEVVHRASLADIVKGPSVWHDTDLSGALGIVKKSKYNYSGSWLRMFVTDNPDIALGQAASGVLIEFNPERLNGFEHFKPGTTDTTGHEYSVDKSIYGSIKSLTFKSAKTLEAFKRRFPNSFDYENTTDTERGTKVNRKGAEPVATPEPTPTAGTFSPSGEAARNAEALANTPKEREVEGAHQLVQSHELVESMNKVGAATIQPGVAQLLGYQDLITIETMGGLMSGGTKTYTQLKTLITDPYQQKWMARIGVQKWEKVFAGWNELIKQRDLLADKMTKPGMLRTIAREAKAGLAKLNAENNLAISHSIIESALKSTTAILNAEAKDDLKIAVLEGRLKGIKDAAASPAAMGQILNDMVNVLWSNPSGQQLLLGHTAGHLPAGTTVRSQFKQIYIAIKKSVGQPLHNPTLISWASYILTKNMDLKDALVAQMMATKVPSMKAALSAYETKFLGDFDKDPVATVKRALRDRGKLVTDKERTAFTWQVLNKKMMDQFAEFAKYDEAAEIAKKTMADPDIKATHSAMLKDAAYIGRQKPAEPYLDSIVLLPSGKELSIQTAEMVGAKSDFAAKRADYEAGITELKNWLNDPANANDVNWGTHMKNLETLQLYFAGLSILQPNDALMFKNKTYDILVNAINRAGGRVAGSVKRAVADLERISQLAAWWNQRTTYNLATISIRAFKSHGLKWSSFGEMTYVDAINTWWRNVGNQLAASWNEQVDGLNVGDKTGSGWEVTRDDMNFLMAMSDATSETFKFDPGQMTEDTLGGATMQRKAMKGSRYMTTRMFDNTLRDTFAVPFAKAYEALLEAQGAGNVAAANAAKATMTKLIDLNFKHVGYPFIWHRNPQFAKAGPFDGAGGAFEVVRKMMEATPTRIADFAQLTSEIAALSVMTPDQVSDILLLDWGNMMKKYAAVTVKDPQKDVPRAKESTNSFTQSRNEAVAPYVFYQNGFKNSHTVASHAAGIYSRQLDRIVAGMNAIIADLERQQGEMKAKIDQRGDTSKARKEVAALNEQEIANGDTYDDYLNLKQRKSFVEDALQLLVGDRSDVDIDITMARSIGALTGALVSGVITTLKNVSLGPLYLGHVAYRMSGSTLYSFPMSMYQLWINAQSRIILSTLGGMAKAATIDLIHGSYEAFKGLAKKEGRDTRVFVDTMFRRVVEELGERSYSRVSSLREMMAKGIHFIPPAVKEFDARILGSVLSGGLQMGENMTLGQKLKQSPVAIFETMILTLTKAYAPLFGDSALNMATYDLLQSSYGPIQNMDARLRSLFLDYQKMGLTNFKDRRYSAKEIMPPSLRDLRLFGTSLDMQKLREFYELAGFNFDEKVSEFLTKLQAGVPNAQFLTDEERKQIINTAINFSNRATKTNNTLALKRKSFINNFVAPFMPWKVRMLSNITNLLSIPRASGNTKWKRTLMWAMLLVTILLPFMFWSSNINTGAEEQARVEKKGLFNQVNSTREPWEREGAKSQAIGWTIQSVNGLFPFLDMAVNAGLNDLPNRASLDPSLAVVEKAKDVAKYIGGAVQTGDLTYKLPELIGSILPDTKVVMNRLDSQSGLREANNMVAELKRHAPPDMVRPSYGSSAGINVTPLAPLIQRMENAAYTGNDGELQAAYAEAVAKAEEMGHDEKYVKQLFAARNPVKRALTGTPTPEVLDKIRNAMPSDERGKFDEGQSKFMAAAQTLGVNATFDRPAGAAGGGGGGAGVGAGLAATTPVGGSVKTGRAAVRRGIRAGGKLFRRVSGSAGRVSARIKRLGRLRSGVRRRAVVSRKSLA